MGLTGAAFGGLGAAGTQPGGRQVRASLGEALFEIPDLTLKLVFGRSGFGSRCRGSRHRPFGILKNLPAVSGTFCCFPGQPLLLRLRSAGLLLVRQAPWDIPP